MLERRCDSHVFDTFLASEAGQVRTAVTAAQRRRNLADTERA